MIFQVISGVIITALGVAIFLLALRLGRHSDKVPVVGQVIDAYTQVAGSAEFREIERQRALAQHNEASALATMARKTRDEERMKWQGVVADKDATIAGMGATIADKDAENERLRAQVAELLAKQGG